MRNSPGCVTGRRLGNRTPSCTTGCPDVLPESLPILLLNRVGVAIYPVTQPGNRPVVQLTEF